MELYHSRIRNDRYAQGLQMGGAGIPSSMGAMSEIGKAFHKLSEIGSNSYTKMHGAIGSAIIGGIGNHMMSNKPQSLNNHIIRNLHSKLKKTPATVLGGYRIGKRLRAHEAASIFGKHRDQQIHVRDIWGEAHNKYSQQLLHLVDQARQSFKRHNPLIQGTLTKGSGMSGGKINVKGFAMKALHKLKDFANGKTKFKPHELANYMAGAVGIAGSISAAIPGVDLISVPTAAAVSAGLKTAGTMLKMSGRGPHGVVDTMRYPPGEGVAGVVDTPRIPPPRGRKPKARDAPNPKLAKPTMPKPRKPQLAKPKIPKAPKPKVPKIPEVYKQKQAPEQKNKGTSGLSGIPKAIMKYIRAHPQATMKIAKYVLSLIKKLKGKGNNELELAGKGVGKQILTTIGLAGSAVVGAIAMYKYMLANPSFTSKVASEGALDLVKKQLGGGIYLAGQGVNLAGGCKSGSGCTKGSGVNLAGSHKKCQCGTGYKDKKFPKNVKVLPGVKIPKVSKKMAANITAQLDKKFEKSTGKGIYLAGQGELPHGVTRLKNGKIKKSRYSVFHGYHKKTSGGLTKDAFFLRGKKVISKKQSARAKKNNRFGKKKT